MELSQSTFRRDDGRAKSGRPLALAHHQSATSVTRLGGLAKDEVGSEVRADKQRQEVLKKNKNKRLTTTIIVYDHWSKMQIINLFLLSTV